MAGEVVLHYVRSDSVRKPKPLGFLLNKQIYRAWKQSSFRADVTVPVFRKDIQVFITKYGITVLPVLRQLDMDHLLCPADIPISEKADVTDPMNT